MAAISFRIFSVPQIIDISSLQVKIKTIKLACVIDQVFCHLGVVRYPGLQRGDVQEARYLQRTGVAGV